MSEPAISIRELSKRYRLGAITRHTLGEEITYFYHKVCGRNAAEKMGKVKNQGERKIKRQSDQHNPNDFWALNKVTFDVQPGEIVGIIGGNGAGKSTLLKILSKITEPTEGEAFLNGRVGSLLEVGTGFHPELTGRENIFMSGTIQGMKKCEITARFDEIVAFSEIDQFLDTPVKRYSSGMFVRLAFAVAAHMEPEILIVDEVLAVGDAAFQKKCLGKMGDVAKQGRTILFVSHNMAAVENLCTHALWLDQGKLQMLGETSSVIEHYLSTTQNTLKTVSLRNRVDRRGTGRARIVDFFITDSSGKKQGILRPGNTYQFNLKCEISPEITNLSNVIASMALSDLKNETVWLVNSKFTHEYHELSASITMISCTVPDFAVAEGTYYATLYLGHGEVEILDLVSNAAEITIEGGNFFGTGSKGAPTICKTLTHASWKSSP